MLELTKKQPKEVIEDDLLDMIEGILKCLGDDANKKDYEAK